MEFKFPRGFVLGVSSAATQIEGGCTNNSWNDWYAKGHIKDGSDPARANGHWLNWREDVELMAKMGIRACRFGIEWARICPKEGEIDQNAIARYREELSLMRELGISPLMTLHHFTNPMWFEEKGGFEKRENIGDFMDFVDLAVNCFGDLVSDYITINEPNVYATNGFYFGDWPPGKRSVKAACTVMSNLAYCHIMAYEMIHAIREERGFTDTRVGLASHMRVFAPKNHGNPAHIAAAGATRWLFQGAINLAMCKGDFRAPLRAPYMVLPGEYCDFHGLNYYTRSTVTGLGDGVRENCPQNDLGWEIYPQGLVQCARDLFKLLPRPIWVTENGTCDNTDAFRAKYICDHLAAISSAPLPIERYYHWCFCDNFEWLEGESARFGIVHVDYDSQKRSVKRSGEFFSAMIARGGVSEEMFREYVENEEYNVK